MEVGTCMQTSDSASHCTEHSHKQKRKRFVNVFCATIMLFIYESELAWLDLSINASRMYESVLVITKSVAI